MARLVKPIEMKRVLVAYGYHPNMLYVWKARGILIEGLHYIKLPNFPRRYDVDAILETIGLQVQPAQVPLWERKSGRNRRG